MSRQRRRIVESMATGLVLGFLVLPAQAAEVRLGGIVPGAGVITKKVLSMREARYVEMVPQQLDFSCGAAAVATILTYAYGKERTEAEVLREMLAIADEETVKRLGFSLLDIKHYVESIGMQGVGFRLPPENLEKVKLPTIVLLDIKGYKHFAVMKMVRDDKVYVADPALGNKVMRKEDFLALWNGIVFAVVGEGYDQETILRRPREPLSARKLLGQRAPFLPAKLLDFGYLHADMF